MKNFIIGWLILCIGLQTAIGQSMVNRANEAVMGQPCPDISLAKVDFYKQNRLSINELRGKWVVLDFWDRFCGSCIGSFPHISETQKEFNGRVQFLMVTYDDPDHLNRTIFSKYHQKLDLAMPCAYNGTANNNGLFKQFNVGQLPFIVVIDPKGIIRTVTSGITKEQLTKLITGKSTLFNEASYADRRSPKGKIKYDDKIPFLVGGNGGVGSNFEYRSLLAKWTNNIPFGWHFNFYSSKNNWLELLRTDLGSLYRMAYLKKITGEQIRKNDTVEFDKVWSEPVLETKDSILFRANTVTGENVFCYSLIVPPKKADNNYLFQILQSDLKNYFGFDVAIEIRKMPYWKLVVSNKKLADQLKSKGVGNGLSAVIPFLKYEVRNEGLKRFRRDIDFLSGLSIVPAPLVDETGITYKIDINLDVVKGNFESTNEALKKNGLEIVPGEKEMKVLVIKDPHITNTSSLNAN